MIVQAHALWITQASSTTIQALLSLRECSSNISSKFPPKQTLLPIWATAVITTWLHIFFYKTFVRYTPLPSSKKSYATSARRNRHQQRNCQGPLCKILRITQIRQFALHWIISPKTMKLFAPCVPLP